MLFRSYTAMVAGATSDSLNNSTGTLTITGAHTHNSLKLTTGATLALGANPLTLTSGGLLSTGTAASSITGTAGGTRLTAGNGSGSYELILHQYNTGGLTISAVIGNNGANAVSLTKSGTGTLSLGGINTHSGGTYLNSGTLFLNTTTALGSGTFTINPNTTIDSTLAGWLNANNNAIVINGDFTYGGASTSGMNLGTGAVTLNANVIFNQGNRGFTIGGVISGNFGFTKNGPNTLFLNGANLYTGDTKTIGGTLQLGHNLALQNSAFDTSGGGPVTFLAGVTTPTFGGLVGPTNFTLAAGVTSLTLNPGSGVTKTYTGALGSTTAGMTLTKTGLGTQIFVGASTYTGATTITAGKLLANNTAGSATGTGNVLVTAGIFGGTGAISGKVIVSGTGILSPGASIESLSTGMLEFQGGSLVYELTTSTLDGDLVDVNGNLSISGSVLLSVSDLGTDTTLALGSKLTLISYTGTWDGGTFTGLADGASFLLGSNQWQINYDDVTAGANVLGGGTGTSFVTITTTAVPEPSGFALAALGALGLGMIFRRRR